MSGKRLGLEPRVDLAGPLRQIAARLGVHYESIAHIRWTPGECEVLLLVRDENGKVIITAPKGDPKVETRKFKITT